MKDRKEDRLFKADLTINGAEVKGIPCKLFLPERIYETPYCIFHPAQESSSTLMNSYEGGMKADIYDFDGKISAKIESKNVYLSKTRTKIWAKDILETTIFGEPQDLHIVQYLHAHSEPTKTNIVFWISNSKHLSPAIIAEHSYTGDIKNKRIKNLEFVISNGKNIFFDRHFKNKELENGDQLHWSFLVGTVDVDDFPADDSDAIKKEILPNVDDFLLVASFAERARIACLGWSASDQKSIAEFYRGNYTFPKEPGNDDHRDGVVDRRMLEEFMSVCYENFLRFENKHSLRSALHSAVGAEADVLEMSFLRMFAGLESLILDYKRRKDIEFVLDDEQWKSFQLYLKGCIKKSECPSLTPEQRASIYTKLGELNRASLSEAFDLFCKEYCIDLSDLWPVFSLEKHKAGLVNVRNRLIHGDPFPSTQLHQLAVAREHLQYTLERVLVRVLGFEVAKTNVCPEWLRQYTAILELTAARTEISEHT